MEIRLCPELADFVKQDVERGAYASIGEYVEQAVSMLHVQGAWLAANRFDIQSKIEAGYASAQRGELIEPDEVRQELAKGKRTRPANP
jgi:Arc/MetJ-type ribon-helix-helix transcriptional regulator